MKRCEEKLKERAQFVQEYVNKYEGKTEAAVRELSEVLFLSERTIWRVLTDTTETSEQKTCNNE
jgi:hypothetical protein